MLVNRFEIRNEYSLADSELYRAADKDDPEALLESVAMAGLVGILRQLGNLTEWHEGMRVLTYTHSWPALQLRNYSLGAANRFLDGWLHSGYLEGFVNHNMGNNVLMNHGLLVS